jgi:hypothetical protein
VERRVLRLLAKWRDPTDRTTFCFFEDNGINERGRSTCTVASLMLGLILSIVASTLLFFTSKGTIELLKLDVGD